MRGRSRTIAALGATAILLLPATARGQALPAAASAKEAALSTHARGTFDVKLTPEGPDEAGEQTPLGRMSIEKQFQGDLAGAGKGEMLTALTAVKGSAGYVAVERVSGTLAGRRGTFVLLQHTGTMTRGAQQLKISVVPDSGTGELMGISGAMTIEITNGKHFYDFEYTLVQGR